MTEKTIDQLIDEAHDYFNLSSIYEVMDCDESQARAFLNQKYDNPDTKRVDAYLEVVQQVKQML